LAELEFIRKDAITNAQNKVRKTEKSPIWHSLMYSRPGTCV
jgi:hypothetical protein